MRRGNTVIYNRNDDAPLRHVYSLALKHSLCNTAHVATLSPFAQNLGHPGQCHRHLLLATHITLPSSHLHPCPLLIPFIPPGHSAESAWP